MRKNKNTVNGNPEEDLQGKKIACDITGSTLQRTDESLLIKPSAYRELMRNRDFLRLWLGQMISAIGDWVIVAVLFTFVDRLSGGKSYAISLMMLARFLPAILLGFFAGVVIDRFDRKVTLIVCDLARAGLVILFPFSTTLVMICLLVFIMETFTIIYGPAKDASIPDLVQQDQLMNANSLNSVTLFASMAFGTAIAGGIVSLVNWLAGGLINPNKAAFFIDSLTFITSAYLIFRIHFKKRGPEDITRISAQQVKTDIVDGIKYMWGHELTRIILFLTVVCFLGGGTVYVLAVGFVKYVLGGSDADFMAVLTTLLFGLMTGSLLAGILKRFVRKERWLGRSIYSFGFCIIIFSLLTLRWLSFIIIFTGGMCMGYGVVGMITLLHETLEEEFRGRVFATITALMRTSIFVSIMIAGPLADAINFIGKAWGVPGRDILFVRIGGLTVTTAEGEVLNFHYLLNGPQIILIFGALLIVAAGFFANHRFKVLFARSSESSLEREPLLEKGLLNQESGAGGCVADLQAREERGEETSTGGSVGSGEEV